MNKYLISVFQDISYGNKNNNFVKKFSIEHYEESLYIWNYNCANIIVLCLKNNCLFEMLLYYQKSDYIIFNGSRETTYAKNYDALLWVTRTTIVCLIYEHLSITRHIPFDGGHEYMKLVST